MTNDENRPPKTFHSDRENQFDLQTQLVKTLDLLNQKTQHDAILKAEMKILQDQILKNLMGGK